MTDGAVRSLFQVLVQTEDFDAAKLQSELLQDRALVGGVVCFTGHVRAYNNDRPVHTLELEHYPGMTEGSISAIVLEARERWPLLGATVVHRVGKLSPGDQIVWVGVAAAHREASFGACEFIMDYLKTQAPFWKKELGSEGEHWVDAREKDAQRAARWRT